MFKRLIKNKKGQNTAEYAILISLVVASIVAMQTYAQRALNARVKDASDNLTQSDAISGRKTKQYEPYYQESSYTVTTNSRKTERLDTNLVSVIMNDSTTRDKNGYQESTYDPSQFNRE